MGSNLIIDDQADQIVPNKLLNYYD